MDIDKALESIKKINLRGGIFGKTSLLLIFLCIGIVSICLRIPIWWFCLIIIFLLIGIVFYALKRSFDFAEKNPYPAIMDGAELILHERILHGRKGHEVLTTIEPTIDHEIPLMLEAGIEIEDSPALPALPSNNDPPNKEDK